MTNNKPEVSVLLSCFNGASWLQEAISSVRSQSFSNFELLIVDDGSTDDSWSIIEENAREDVRIVGIKKNNTGLAESLNLGIWKARGEFIARLDADDLCEPDRLTKQVGYMRSHPDVVLVGSWFNEVDERGKVTKSHQLPTDNSTLVRNLELLRAFFPHSSALYRTEAVRSVGGYNVKFRRSQDHRLWLKLSKLGKIGCIAETLVRIRMHPAQMSVDAKQHRQLCYGAASVICHSLLYMGCPKPPDMKTECEWKDFLLWLDERMTERKVFERRVCWNSARAAYFDETNACMRMYKMVITLHQAGHLFDIVLEKAFGARYLRGLAERWLNEKGGQ